MPDPRSKPWGRFALKEGPPSADGQQDGDDGGDDQSQQQQSGQGGQQSGGQGRQQAKVFTQEEIDAIVEQRALREVRSKYGDYDSLKSKAEKYDEAQKAAQSDLEKEQAARTKAEQERDAARAEIQLSRIEGAIRDQAVAQKAIDPEAVMALVLREPESVTYVDGKVQGAKEAVAALLKARPILVASTKRSGGEFGGEDPATIDQRIVELEKGGKWAEARALKMRKITSPAQ